MFTRTGKMTCFDLSGAIFEAVVVASFLIISPDCDSERDSGDIFDCVRRARETNK